MSTWLPLDASADRRSERRWDVVALVIFLLATLWLHRELIGADWREETLVGLPAGAVDDGRGYPGQSLVETDHQFVIWLISRNARVVSTAPLSLHDAEPCFPTPDSLALGEPALSLSWLGGPAWLISGDPLATYSAVLFWLPVFSALALYWLVKRWTGVPAAGIVAGLFYGFNALKVQDPVHFYVYDTLGTVLALFFAERFFSQRKWRDVMGLGVSVALQLGGSLYAVVAAVLVAIPFVVFGLRRDGIRSQRPAQWVVLVGLIAAVAWLFYAPILAMSSAGELSERPLQIFRPLTIYLPGQVGFPGWPTLLLLVAAFLWPATTSLPGVRGDPRIPVLISILLIQLISVGAWAGDFTVPVVWDRASEPPPNLYMALSMWLPGLDLVRAPAAIFNCAVPLIGILVGVGAAGCLRALSARVGRSASLAIVAVLVSLIFVDQLRPPLLGLDAHYTYRSYRMRPPDDRIAFFERLAEAGNAGPILMIPATPRRPRRESGATLLAAYHQRRIGQCYNSQHPPAVAEVRALSESLPEPDAIARLAGLGFTTFVVTHGPGDFAGPGRRARWLEAAGLEDAPIRFVVGDPLWSAFEVVGPGVAP